MPDDPKQPFRPADMGEAMAHYGHTGVFGTSSTFLGIARADLRDPSSLDGADIVVVGAPFDGGTSYRPGARLAPQAIRTADYLPLVPYRPHFDLGVDPFSVLRVVDGGDVAMPPGDLERALELLEDAVATIVSRGAVPVILGGDHTIALPDMTAVARGAGNRPITVVHFDAHPDIGDTNDFGSRFGHGTAMRRVLENGVVPGDRFFQMGLRGYWPGPATMQWAADRGVRWCSTNEIARRGMAECLSDALESARTSAGLYLSVDVDVVDPGLAPGTGTPEPGGLTARELLEAVRICTTSVPFLGLEIVEVSPPYDHANITCALANRIVLEALSGFAWQRTNEVHR